jgi:YfiH family protein
MAHAECVFDKKLPIGRFCIYQSRPNLAFIKVKQTHSDIVHEENNCNEIEGDGMVGISKMPMAILTADCLPVVLIGEGGHAFVHAGWRGLQNKILTDLKIAALRPYYAFVGPHISARHYEVSPDFKENFPAYPEAFSERDGKIFFDMNIVVTKQLSEVFPGIEVDISPLCTFEGPSFFSYRRNKTTERNWNIYIP